MSVLKPADFYYGAFLSALLNYAGKKPSLFDSSTTDSRRIYCLTTDKSKQDYLIYTKYGTVRKSKTEKKGYWSFTFTQYEVDKIVELQQQSGNACVALICLKEELKDCELAFLRYDVAADCLGISERKSSYRINVIAIDNKHGLRVYGSGRVRKNPDGKDNMVNVPRDALKEL